MGMGVSCRHLTKHSVLVHGCDLTGDITAAVADGSAEGEQAQPSFLLAVMQGSCCFDAGSGTGLPWGCPCRLQSLGGAGLGWAGRCPRQDRRAKCKARSAHTPCCD